jgi:hypothetical protein
MDGSNQEVFIIHVLYFLDPAMKRSAPLRQHNYNQLKDTFNPWSSANPFHPEPTIVETTHSQV